MTKKDNFYELVNQYKGEGIYLYVNDKKYIDAASGTFNLPLGYNHNRLVERLKQQLDRCIHLSSQYTKEISDCVFQNLIKYLPEGFDRMWFRDVSGSGAVEGAIKIAQKYTNQPGIISLFLSHHGHSLATSEISGSAFRVKNFFAGIEGSFRIPLPESVLSKHNEQYHGDLGGVSITNLENFIEFASNGKIAALIIEPILGNGGNIVLPKAFYREVRSICTKYNILIIADEVQTGFGRTGTFFATTGYAKDLEPDIIVFAKGSGGIGVPTGGMIMKNHLDILEPYEHSCTSGANLLSLIALYETIKVIEDENILDNVLSHESYLMNGLLELEDKYDLITGVRGVGYMFGFDVPDPSIVAKAIKVANKHNLIIRGSRYGKGNTVKVRPPLISSKNQLAEILSKLDDTFNEITNNC